MEVRGTLFGEIERHSWLCHDIYIFVRSTEYRFNKRHPCCIHGIVTEIRTKSAATDRLTPRGSD